MLTLIIGVLITLLFSAFFSGMEIAFVSSNKMLAEMEREEKNGLPQKCLHRFFVNPSNFISTMLVGNNIALVVYGILIAELFDKTIFVGMPAGFTVPADTLLSTCIVLFTGEFLPKTLFKINPNKTLTTFAVPTYILYVLLFPISRFATALSQGLLRLFGVKVDKEKGKMQFSKVDLDYLVQSSIDNARSEEEITDEVKIFQNALDFSDTKVRDCMIPRTELVAVDINCKIDELLDIFVESGKSKVVVYEGDIDHILGYIHSSEMFRLSLCNTKDYRKETLKSLTTLHIMTMPIVPEIMAARKLMHTFMQENKTLGVVVDEFGGTSGIVALEDLVEEIFGDIEDEHDKSVEFSQKVADDEYLLSARLEITKVNELYELNLPESDDYLTLGGLILHKCARFPKLNEEIRVGKYRFKILRKTASKLELLKLKVVE
ncbi:MAG: hemolysin family protein [Prevotellaceae bacterium]|nr:hemolysin family protein [Prevotellaceae bacterium]